MKADNDGEDDDHHDDDDHDGDDHDDDDDDHDGHDDDDDGLGVISLSECIDISHIVFAEDILLLTINLILSVYMK